MPSFIILGHVWQILGRGSFCPAPSSVSSLKMPVLNRVKPLVLAALKYYSGETNIKCGLPSKYLFQKTQQHGGCTKLLGNDKFAWKKLFPVITRNKKQSSKQVVSVMNTLGKDFFATATFKGLWDASFETK